MAFTLSEDEIKKLRKTAANFTGDSDDDEWNHSEPEEWSEAGIKRARADLARLVLKEAGIPLEE